MTYYLPLSSSVVILRSRVWSPCRDNTAAMDRYELSTQIGDGSFGRVMKATSKETGDTVRRRTRIFFVDFYGADSNLFLDLCRARVHRWQLNISNESSKRGRHALICERCRACE